MRHNMLEVKDVSVRMGGKVLFGPLSFHVDDGMMACVRGESGSGKTTLLRAIMGLTPLDQGHISIDGELLTLASAGEFRKLMAYVPQSLTLPVEWVSEMARLPFTLRENKRAPFSKERLMEEWRKLELSPDLYGKRVGELSGGERQRVALSAAGILGKPIILADEPTGALDRHTRAVVATYLKNLAAEGATVVAVSHDEEFAAVADMQVVTAAPGDGIKDDRE